MVVQPLFNFAPDVFVAFSQTEINERIEDWLGNKVAVVVVELLTMLCSEHDLNRDKAICFSQAFVWLCLANFFPIQAFGLFGANGIVSLMVIGFLELGCFMRLLQAVFHYQELVFWDAHNGGGGLAVHPINRLAHRAFTRSSMLPAV